MTGHLAHLVTFHGPIFKRLPTIEHPDGCDGDDCAVLDALTKMIAATDGGDPVDGVYRSVGPDRGTCTGFERVGARP